MYGLVIGMCFLILCSNNKFIEINSIHYFKIFSLKQSLLNVKKNAIRIFTFVDNYYFEILHSTKCTNDIWIEIKREQTDLGMKILQSKKIVNLFY